MERLRISFMVLKLIINLASSHLKTYEAYHPFCHSCIVLRVLQLK